ncbi:UbiX family flavin prenyltransferase [Desulfospira joergensenii]|uniref:UbiX family flavin prenyltransferase n=1 Tax=Desulfospira joergensenii TaxID=53329 RepID=UPI0003B71A78|nr:flavin prenyltransferase UbiX [Desulfospira joergensenii]
MNQDKPGATNSDKTYVVAITGASGSIYGIRLIKALIEQGYQVLAIVSHAGLQVLVHEMGYDPKDSFYDFLEQYGVNFSKGSRLEVFTQDDIASAPASGSFVHSGMAVMPCSMKTLAAVASGYADNLITRSCDVCLKEKRTLILGPRESPMGIIHLENMTRAARAGAVILPPNPSFYTFPRNVEALVDTVVARTMDHLGAEHELGPRWES